MPMTATVACRARRRSMRSSAPRPSIRGAAPRATVTAGPSGPGCGLRSRAAARALPRSLFTGFSVLAAAFIVSLLLRPLLAVMPNQTFPHAAFLNSCDHILETLVHRRIVDDPAQRAFSAVHFPEDGIGVPRGAVDLLQQAVSVGRVIHQPADETLALAEILGRFAQGGGAGPQVVHHLGALAIR